MTVRIYFDGGYYPETGEMFCAVKCGAYEDILPLGAEGTSSTQSEWITALNALEYAVEQSFSDVTLVGDSANVVHAMGRGWKVNEGFIQYRVHAKNLSEEIGNVVWEWIDRDHNPAGRLLERMDTARKLAAAGVSE